MGKYSLLVIGGLVLAAGLITSNLNQVSEYFVDDLIEHNERAEARLVANSMAHMSLAMLRDSSSWRDGYSGVSIGEGTGWATLDDNTTDTTLIAGLVRITAWGTSGGTADTATVIVKFPTILPGVCAGVTAHSDVVGRGNMVIDGRNHDLNGIVIVILLDLRPKVDGYQVCRRLKTDPETGHIPIVMLTALDAADKVKGIMYGADESLTKPVDLELLDETVSRVLVKAYG